MPNWVYNTVIVSKKDLPKFKELLVNKGQVDFNKLIPMSDELNIENYAYTYNEKTTLKDVIDSCLRKRLGLKETPAEQFIEILFNNKHFRNIIKGYHNTLKYGSKDWYDGCCNNWGTKWNAHESKINEDIIIFQTAWGEPCGIYAELSKHIDFKVIYHDEFIGQNFGAYEYKNGKKIDYVEWDSEDKETINIGKGYAVAGCTEVELDEYLKGLKENNNLTDEELEQARKEVYNAYDDTIKILEEQDL